MSLFPRILRRGARALCASVLLLTVAGCSMVGLYRELSEARGLGLVTGPATTPGGGTEHVYVALFNSTVNDTWTTTSTGECAGSTYARVAVTNSSANWTNSTAGSKQNKTEVSFTTAAGADWGTIQSFAICDSNSTSAGNVYYRGDLTSSQVISSGNVVKFTTGSITITED